MATPKVGLHRYSQRVPRLSVGALALQPLATLMPCVKLDRALLGWSFDLITELELMPEGNRYLLVGIDCFSKWTVIHPLRPKSSEEISY